MKNTYSELLKDPRWQKKRLKILDRDGFECKNCGDTTKTLHVHHRRYINGRNPWEYEDSNLVTLCCDCHKIEGDVYDDELHDFVAVIQESFLSKELHILTEGFVSLRSNHSHETIAKIIRHIFSDWVLFNELSERYFESCREYQIDI